MNHYEPCNTTTFIWSLPAEVLIAIVALLSVHDLCSITRVCSLLREITGPIFFVNRNFPTLLQDMVHICVDSPNFDVLATWIWMDTFCPPRMMLCWLNSDLGPSQLSAFSHFLHFVCQKSIQYIMLSGISTSSLPRFYLKLSYSLRISMPPVAKNWHAWVSVMAFTHCLSMDSPELKVTWVPTISKPLKWHHGCYFPLSFFHSQCKPSNLPLCKSFALVPSSSVLHTGANSYGT